MSNLYSPFQMFMDAIKYYDGDIHYWDKPQKDIDRVLTLCQNDRNITYLELEPIRVVDEFECDENENEHSRIIDETTEVMNAAGSSDDDLVCLGEINQEEVKKSANRQYGSSQQ